MFFNKNQEAMLKETDDKWTWKMEWCKTHGYPPANEYYWNLAEVAYIDHIDKNYLTED